VSAGEEASERRIAEARSSPATLPRLEALAHRSFPSLLRARALEGAGADRPYLVFHGPPGGRCEISHGELLRRVAARAHRLARHAGVRRGDRVALLLRNDPEVAVSHLAIWALGASAVPLNLGEDPERLAFVLEHSEPRAALHLPEVADLASALRARAAGVEHWLPTGPDAPAPPSFGPDPDVSGEDEALVVYTSGTTGPPKGVVLTQQNLLVDADAIARWHRLGPEARLLCVLPTHHVNGLVVTLVTPFLVGGSVVLERRFRTEAFFPLAVREGVQVASVVPTLLAFLLEGGAPPAAPHAFRYPICGAGPLTVELGARFEERFGFPILHGYGLSETTCYSCFLPLDLDPSSHRHWMRDFGFPSIGVPLDVNEMAIHDPSGQALGRGQRGEIVLRGVNVMRGYHRRPEANAESFAFGWFRSGDEGFFEEDDRGRRFFFITGRLKELIIRGGVNLSPFEIDEVLCSIPGVARGLAVGFENDWYGEEVGAYVQLEPGAHLRPEEIQAACRARLSFAKTPKVVLLGDELPVTSTGKYQRGRLRHHFAAYKSVQFREERR
jgi:long-chain acyl-CoA synthetase